MLKQDKSHLLNLLRSFYGLYTVLKCPSIFISVLELLCTPSSRTSFNSNKINLHFRKLLADTQFKQVTRAPRFALQPYQIKAIEQDVLKKVREQVVDEFVTKSKKKLAPLDINQLVEKTTKLSQDELPAKEFDQKVSLTHNHTRELRHTKCTE